MVLTATDWIVIAAYLLLNLLISLYYRRRFSGSTEEFFVSGAKLSWWFAGVHGGHHLAPTLLSRHRPGCTQRHFRQLRPGWSQCLCGMMTACGRYWRRPKSSPTGEPATGKNCRLSSRLSRLHLGR
jgi:hypothetical protein